MTAGAARIRLDILLVERGLVPSRERARALILAGRVLVREQKVDKPGANVPEDSLIRLLGEEQPYVSRGGLKLAEALRHWQISVSGRACLDVGASTGGFTDCLLQHGAAHVTAVDTGFGQIAMKLRNDARVRLLERTNARFLEPNSLVAKTAPGSGSELGQGTTFVVAKKGLDSSEEPEKRPSGARARVDSVGLIRRLKPPPPSVSNSSSAGSLAAPQMPQKESAALASEGIPGPTLLTMDVSFISATLLLEPVFAAAPALVEAVILVKPQFEAGRGQVGKGGIVRDPEAHQLAVDRVAGCVRSLGWEVVEAIPSPISGAEGNREFLLYARRVGV